MLSARAAATNPLTLASWKRSHVSQTLNQFRELTHTAPPAIAGGAHSSSKHP